ncbi:MAG: hypothetical protein AB1757_23435 [Acidobacteriota bacterium]
MKRFFIVTMMLVLLAEVCPLFAQDKDKDGGSPPEAAVGLNLVAFGELFKGAENLQAFEKAVNDPAVGVNNLDLDENGEVDFLRVQEEVADDTHVVVVQATLGKDEVQDVAAIEVEKVSDNQYNFQIHGDEELYGEDYYIVPVEVEVYRWPIINVMYRPAYRPYRSTFYFGVYPTWYRPFRPVTFGVYRTRTVRFTVRPTFSLTRTTRVRTVSKVRYTPARSTKVKRKTTITHTRGKTTVTRSTTVKTRKRKP